MARNRNGAPGRPGERPVPPGRPSHDADGKPIIYDSIGRRRHPNQGMPHVTPPTAAQATAATVRDHIKRLAELGAPQMLTWLAQIKDPARRCEIFLRALEYHVPKLERVEHVGEEGGPVLHSIGIELIRPNAGALPAPDEQTHTEQQHALAAGADVALRLPQQIQAPTTYAPMDAGHTAGAPYERAEPSPPLVVTPPTPTHSGF